MKKKCGSFCVTMIPPEEAAAIDAARAGELHPQAPPHRGDTIDQPAMTQPALYAEIDRLRAELAEARAENERLRSTLERERGQKNRMLATLRSLSEERNGGGDSSW